MEKKNQGLSIIVVGMESTGSMLIARILADAVGLADFGKWDSIGWIRGDNVEVCHRSIPYDIPSKFITNRDFLEQANFFDVRYVIATRDITISEISRIKRFGKSKKQVRNESEHALLILKEIITQERAPSFVFSYETFMAFQEEYFKRLADFLELKEFSPLPHLQDANVSKIRFNPILQLNPIFFRIKKLAKRILK